MAAEQCNKTNDGGAQCLSTTGHRGRHRYPVAATEGTVEKPAEQGWKSTVAVRPKHNKFVAQQAARIPSSTAAAARNELEAMTSMLETLVALEPRQRLRLLKHVSSYLADLDQGSASSALATREDLEDEAA